MDTRYKDLATFAVFSPPVRDFPKWKTRLGQYPMLISYEPENNKGVPTMPKRRWEDEATSQGFLFMDYASTDDSKVLLEEAKQPNRVGWMIKGMDEPDSSNHNISAEKILAEVAIIRKVAGASLPIYINFAGEVVTRINPKKEFTYYQKLAAGGIDIAGEDWYPNTKNFDRYEDWFPMMASDRLVRCGFTNSQIQILECSDQHISDLGRGPTPQEFFFQFWNCVAMGHKPCLFPQKIGNKRDVQNEDGSWPSTFMYDNTTPEIIATIQQCALQYNQLWPYMNASNAVIRRTIVDDSAFAKAWPGEMFTQPNGASVPYTGQVIGVDYINDKVNLLHSFRFNWNKKTPLGLGSNLIPPLGVQIMQTAIGSHPSLLGGTLNVQVDVPGFDVSYSGSGTTFSLSPKKS